MKPYLSRNQYVPPAQQQSVRTNMVPESNKSLPSLKKSASQSKSASPKRKSQSKGKRTSSRSRSGSLSSRSHSRSKSNSRSRSRSKSRDSRDTRDKGKVNRRSHSRSISRSRSKSPKREKSPKRAKSKSPKRAKSIQTKNSRDRSRSPTSPKSKSSKQSSMRKISLPPLPPLPPPFFGLSKEKEAEIRKAVRQELQLEFALKEENQTKRDQKEGRSPMSKRRELKVVKREDEDKSDRCIDPRRDVRDIEKDQVEKPKSQQEKYNEYRKETGKKPIHWTLRKAGHFPYACREYNLSSCSRPNCWYQHVYAEFDSNGRCILETMQSK